MAEAFHIRKPHGCRCTFKRMDRPEDLVYGVLVGTFLQHEEVVDQVFVVFPGFGNKERPVLLEFRHGSPPSSSLRAFPRPLESWQAGAPGPLHYAGWRISPCRRQGSHSDRIKWWFHRPP